MAKSMTKAGTAATPDQSGNYRRLAEAIADPRGRQLDDAVAHLLTGMAEIFDHQADQLGKKSDPLERAREAKKADAKAPKETRVSRRLLDRARASRNQLLQPIKNAFENFSNVVSARRAGMTTALSKQLGIDKLGKWLEHQSRGLAANKARGGLSRGFSGTARAFGRGAVGPAGTSLAGRAAAGVGGRAVAGAAGGTAAGGTAAEAGAGVGLAAIGTDLAAMAGPIGLATAAAVGFTAAVAKAPFAVDKFTDSMVERSRDLRRFDAGMASAFAMLDRNDLVRSGKFAQGTGGSTAALIKAQNELKDALLPARVAMANLMNQALLPIVKALPALIDGVMALMPGLEEFIAEQSKKQMMEQAAKQMPAAHFLDEVMKGRWDKPKNVPPRKKVP